MPHHVFNPRKLWRCGAGGHYNVALIAHVELQRGVVFDEATARTHLHQHMAPYKQPTHIAIVAELPTSPNGKVLKRQLQLQAAALP